MRVVRLLVIAVLFVTAVSVDAQTHKRKHRSRIVLPANICEDLDRCLQGDRMPANGCQCPKDKELLARLRTQHHPQASKVFVRRKRNRHR